LEIRRLEAQRLQSTMAMNESMATGVSTADLSLYEQYLQAVAARLKIGQRALRRLQVELDGRRHALSETVKELKSYEKYRERRIEEMFAAQKADQARELDEIAIRGFYARKKS